MFEFHSFIFRFNLKRRTTCYQWWAS